MSATMATPSGLPSTITPSQKLQSPHINPSDEEYISSQPLIPTSIDINCIPQPSTKVPPTEPSNTTLKKNSIEPLSIRTINLVHKDADNIRPIPPSSTLVSCKNRKHFESLNIHCIFGCRKFRNQKHLTSETNASIVNSGLLP